MYTVYYRFYFLILFRNIIAVSKYLMLFIRCMINNIVSYFMLLIINESRERQINFLIQIYFKRNLRD